MLLKQTLFAAAATAFLVVPNISQDEADSTTIFPEAEAATAPVQPPQLLLSHSVEVPCPQCKGANTRLKLDFTVEQDGRKLMLNGFELYPSADPWNHDLVSTVVREGEGEGRREKEQRLGYTLLTVPLAFDEEQKLELIDVVFRVIEVGHRAVNSVPIVKLGLVKNQEEEIVIGNVQLLQPAKEVCTTLWCHVKDSVHEVWHGAVNGAISLGGGCSKGKGHADGHGHGHDHAHGHGHGHGQGYGPGHPRPGPKFEIHDSNYTYYSAKTRERARFVQNLISHILLPVLIGVMAGVTLAFFGIFICGAVYRIFEAVRDGYSTSEDLEALARDVYPRHSTAEAEKERLMGDEEARTSSPPAYKDDADA